MPSKLEELKSAFVESLEDLIFSRTERKTIRHLVRELDLNETEKAYMLNEINNLAASKVSDDNGAKIVEWVYEATKTLSAGHSNHSDTSVYFSPGNACRDAICEHIKSATGSIDICVFTISDNYITDELFMAHQLGKSIRIISDNDKALDRGSDVYRMRDAGMNVKFDLSHVHMHHKFAVIDKTVITGSYNWTRTAARENYENILVTENPEVHHQFSKEFDRLWNKFHVV